MIFPGNSYIALFRAKNALLTPFSRHIFLDFSLISKTWFGPTPQQFTQLFLDDTRSFLA